MICIWQQWNDSLWFGAALKLYYKIGILLFIWINKSLNSVCGTPPNACDMFVCAKNINLHSSAKFNSEWNRKGSENRCGGVKGKQWATKNNVCNKNVYDICTNVGESIVIKVDHGNWSPAQFI